MTQSPTPAPPPLTDEELESWHKAIEQFSATPLFNGGHIRILLGHITTLRAQLEKVEGERDEARGEIIALRLAFSQLMQNSRQVNGSVMLDLAVWNAVQKKIREPLLAGYALDEMAALRERALTAESALAAAKAEAAAFAVKSELIYEDAFSDPPRKFHGCKICKTDDVPISEPIAHEQDCPFASTTLGTDMLARMEALEALINHIDKVAYRDSANLRLGEAVPVYQRAKAALTATPEGK